MLHGAILLARLLGSLMAHMPTDDTQATAETTTTKPSTQQRLDALAAEKAALLEATDRPDFVDSNQVPDDEAEDAHLESEEEIDETESFEESDEQSEEELEAEEESQADEDEQDPDPEEEEQQQQSGKKPTQFRLRPKDEVEKRALELRKRNLDMSLKDALAQAEAELNPSSSQQQQEEQATPLDIAAIQERRQEIRTKIKDARANMDFEALNTLEDELEAIDQEELPKAREAQARREQEAAAAATAKWQESSDAAAAAYPDAAKANSPLFTRMAQIDADLKARNDPLFYDSQKPLIIAQMAARELRIAPRPVSSAKKPVARPAPMTAPLKAGQRGAPQAEESSTIKAIRAVKDPEELAALRRRIIGR